MSAARGTREALAAKRAAEVRLGRPVTKPEGVRTRIERVRADGLSLAAIAAGLSAERVPTAQGGQRWWPSTVRSALHAPREDWRLAYERLPPRPGPTAGFVTLDGPPLGRANPPARRP